MRSLKIKFYFSVALISGLLVGSILCQSGSSFAAPDTSYKKVYDAHLQRYVYVPQRSVSDRLRGSVRQGWHNPIIKQGAIGAGVGAATGLITGNGTLRGAGVGALTGAGTGLIDSSRTLEGKPLLKSTLKGAAIGTGASVVTEGSVLKGAAVGAGAGAGAHFLKDWWDNNRR